MVEGEAPSLLDLVVVVAEEEACFRMSTDLKQRRSASVGELLPGGGGCCTSSSAGNNGAPGVGGHNQPAPTVIETDEELARRLHDELNAYPAIKPTTQSAPPTAKKPVSTPSKARDRSHHSKRETATAPNSPPHSPAHATGKAKATESKAHSGKGLEGQPNGNSSSHAAASDRRKNQIPRELQGLLTTLNEIPSSSVERAQRLPRTPDAMLYGLDAFSSPRQKVPESSSNLGREREHHEHARNESRREQGRHELGRQEQGRQEHSKNEQGRQEQGRHEHARQEPSKHEQGPQEQGRQDQRRQEHGRQEQGRQEQGRQEQGRQEHGRQEQSRQEQGRQEQGRHEQGRQEHGKHEQGRQEHAKQEHGRQEHERQRATSLDGELHGHTSKPSHPKMLPKHETVNADEWHSGSDSASGEDSGQEHDAGRSHSHTNGLGREGKIGLAREDSLSGGLAHRKSGGSRSQRTSSRQGPDRSSKDGSADGAHEEGSEPAQEAKKLPKLPMVRFGKKWYRSRVVRDTCARVMLEAPSGCNAEGDPIAMLEGCTPGASFWLLRDHERLWRGSYRGKHWKHLGEGAWEPKEASKNRNKSSETLSDSTQADATAVVGAAASMSIDSKGDLDFGCAVSPGNKGGAGPEGAVSDADKGNAKADQVPIEEIKAEEAARQEAKADEAAKEEAKADAAAREEAKAARKGAKADQAAKEDIKAEEAAREDAKAARKAAREVAKADHAAREEANPDQDARDEESPDEDEAGPSHEKEEDMGVKVEMEDSPEVEMDTGEGEGPSTGSGKQEEEANGGGSAEIGELPQESSRQERMRLQREKQERIKKEKALLQRERRAAAKAAAAAAAREEEEMMGQDDDSQGKDADPAVDEAGHTGRPERQARMARNAIRYKGASPERRGPTSRRGEGKAKRSGSDALRNGRAQSSRSQLHQISSAKSIDSSGPGGGRLTSRNRNASSSLDLLHFHKGSDISMGGHGHHKIGRHRTPSVSTAMLLKDLAAAEASPMERNFVEFDITSLLGPSTDADLALHTTPMMARNRRKGVPHRSRMEDEDKLPEQLSSPLEAAPLGWAMGSVPNVSSWLDPNMGAILNGNLVASGTQPREEDERKDGEGCASSSSDQENSEVEEEEEEEEECGWDDQQRLRTLDAIALVAGLEVASQEGDNAAAAEALASCHGDRNGFLKTALKHPQSAKARLRSGFAQEGNVGFHGQQLLCGGLCVDGTSPPGGLCDSGCAHHLPGGHFGGSHEGLHLPLPMKQDPNQAADNVWGMSNPLDPNALQQDALWPWLSGEMLAGGGMAEGAQDGEGVMQLGTKRRPAAYPQGRNAHKAKLHEQDQAGSQEVGLMDPQSLVGGFDWHQLHMDEVLANGGWQGVEGEGSEGVEAMGTGSMQVMLDALGELQHDGGAAMQQVGWRAKLELELSLRAVIHTSLLTGTPVLDVAGSWRGLPQGMAAAAASVAAVAAAVAADPVARYTASGLLSCLPSMEHVENLAASSGNKQTPPKAPDGGGGSGRQAKGSSKSPTPPPARQLSTILLSSPPLFH
eukprot:gene20303-27061_t